MPTFRISAPNAFFPRYLQTVFQHLLVETTGVQTSTRLVLRRAEERRAAAARRGHGAVAVLGRRRACGCSPESWRAGPRSVRRSSARVLGGVHESLTAHRVVHCSPACARAAPTAQAPPRSDRAAHRALIEHQPRRVVATTTSAAPLSSSTRPPRSAAPPIEHPPRPRRRHGRGSPRPSTVPGSCVDEAPALDQRIDRALIRAAGGAVARIAGSRAPQSAPARRRRRCGRDRRGRPRSLAAVVEEDLCARAAPTDRAPAAARRRRHPSPALGDRLGGAADRADLPSRPLDECSSRSTSPRRRHRDHSRRPRPTTCEWLNQLVLAAGAT